jgi:5-methylthioadenosine/S-adenosylhomocysteine deaminase
MDIAITNTWILKFSDNGLGIIENGGIGIENDKITFIGSMGDFNEKKADIIINGENHVTMPGLVNAHIHSSLTLLRGGAQDLPEIEWMNKGLGPLARHATSEDLLWGAKLGVLEGVRTGTTTFVEYTRNVQNLVKNIYLNNGIRVVATETINEVSPHRDHLKPKDVYEFDRTKGEEEFRQAKELFKKFKTEELVECMFGPQALDMISLELFQTIWNEAKEFETKIHMHVAQGQREQLQIEERYGSDKTTIKVLDDNHLLDERLIAAHLHGASNNEREKLVSKHVKMVGCPSSISMIDGIVPPVQHYLQLGGTVGLGTDQAPGPGTHNMFREMRTISILTKTMLKDPTALPAWEALQLGTINGAKALGIEDKIGSLKVGKKADIITINLRNTNLVPEIAKPFRNFIPNIVYSSTGYEVDNVIINGKLIFHENKFTTLDEEEIINEANKRARRIYDDAEKDWLQADSELVKKVKKGLL